MTRFFIRVFIFCTALLVLAGCVTAPIVNKGIRIITDIELGAELVETSGLYCLDKGFLTINDSGNTAEVFTLSENGSSSSRVYPLSNSDWEAITASQQHIYIADFGNNLGQRTDLKVYQVDGATHELVSTLNFEYADNVPSDNSYLRHDYDAEALVFHNDQLILLTKQWESKTSDVYFLEPSKENQVLTPQKNIKGLPGLVTGVDYRPDYQDFVVVGYKTSMFLPPKPYVAVLANDFTVKKVFPLNGYTQVEGVCSRGKIIWFTQEGSATNPARLVAIELEVN